MNGYFMLIGMMISVCAADPPGDEAPAAAPTGEMNFTVRYPKPCGRRDHPAHLSCLYRPGAGGGDGVRPEYLLINRYAVDNGGGDASDRLVVKMVSGATALVEGLQWNSMKMWVYSATLANLTMAILQLTCDDRGIYECVHGVDGEGGGAVEPIRRNVTLIVDKKEPSLFRDLGKSTYNQDNGVIKPGDTLAYVCQVDLSDNIYFRWKIRGPESRRAVTLDVNDKRLTYKHEQRECYETVTSTLTLGNMSFTEYYNTSVHCVVEDIGATPTGECRKKLDFFISQKVERENMHITTFPDKVLLSRGVTLMCTALGYPEPSITWSWLGKSQIATRQGYGRGVMVIPNFAEKDEGVYTCAASTQVEGVNYTVSREIFVKSKERTYVWNTNMLTGWINWIFGN